MLRHWQSGRFPEIISFYIMIIGPYPVPNGYCSMLSWDLNPGSLVPYCLNHLYNMVFLRQASVSSEDQALL